MHVLRVVDSLQLVLARGTLLPGNWKRGVQSQVCSRGLADKRGRVTAQEAPGGLAPEAWVMSHEAAYVLAASEKWDLMRLSSPVRMAFSQSSNCRSYMSLLRSSSNCRGGVQRP